MMARQALNRKQTRAGSSAFVAPDPHKRSADGGLPTKYSNGWRPCVCQKGYLSNKLICHAQNVPDATTLIKRFGSITAAYRQVGFQPRG
jgi:hypothetical protein